MRCDEVHKYCDGTLHFINKGLATEEKRRELEVQKTDHWMDPTMSIKKAFRIIAHRLEHRNVLQRLESFYGLRKIEVFIVVDLEPTGTIYVKPILSGELANIIDLEIIRKWIDSITHFSDARFILELVAADLDCKYLFFMLHVKRIECDDDDDDSKMQ
ncbi:hypothetical protein OSB04_010048 [Centaurea solstitialis]|uniref:Uncharacterized protein n=1 Tax=Centaurea solstitialis TaxID=347529 RepID=A0AA38T6S8_9ASTR|nr:hypothetical protein OSB04_010048 [Centaurea solstitialis]